MRFAWLPLRPSPRRSRRAASAAVYPPQRQLPATVITDFKAAPTSLLQQYPTGGPQLISRVRDLGALIRPRSPA